MKRSHLLFIACFASLTAFAQKEYPLYPRHIPGAIPGVNEQASRMEELNGDSILIISKVSLPTLTVYLPSREKATGAAVIICPGGGYSILAASHEGSDVAAKFNEMGIAAFVLKYRIPDDKIMTNREIAPLQDAQQAIRTVRKNAKKWGIHKDHIGIMGFSAGGHLASTAGTHYKKDYIKDKPSDNNSLRPDFMILIYPVVSFTDSIGHTGSRDNLLGKGVTPEKIIEYSNELQVTPETPPTFLVHAKDDPVKVENSLAFAAALYKNHVPYELYLYNTGGHGYGMNNKTSDIRWMDLVEKWIGTLFKSK